MTEDLSAPAFSTLAEIKLRVIEFIPNLISALFVIVIGLLLAFFLKWLSCAVVRWIGKVLPSSIAEGSFVQRNLPDLAKGTGRVLFLVVLFLTVTTGLKRLGFQIISDWLQDLAKYLPNVAGSILIIYLGWKAKEYISEFVFKAFQSSNFSHSRLAADSLGWSLFVISALVSLEQIGIDMSLVIIVMATLVGVASAGVALTFALGAKDTISDILCCYQLHKHLKAGQQIEISGHRGTIKSIGPIFVLLECETGQVTVPGSLFNRETTMIQENKKA